MRFKDFIWLLKQKLKNKISFKIYLKGSENINLGKKCKIFRNCELDASRDGKIIIKNGVTLNPYVLIQADNNGEIFIDEGTEINNFSIINSGGAINIGKNVLIGPKVNILAYNHEYKKRSIIIKKQGLKTKPIIIEDDVWIGANVTILSGVKIGKGAVIGANSVVTKNIEPYSVYVGIPARKIKERYE